MKRSNEEQHWNLSFLDPNLEKLYRTYHLSSLSSKLPIISYAFVNTYIMIAVAINLLGVGVPSHSYDKHLIALGAFIGALASEGVILFVFPYSGVRGILYINGMAFVLIFLSETHACGMYSLPL